MVLALAFAPDSSTLAVAGGRELISLIDLPPIRAELAGLGLDRSEPEAAAADLPARALAGGVVPCRSF